MTCFVPSTDRRQSTRRHDLSLTTSTDDTSPSNYDDAYNRREFFQQAARYAATATTTSTCTAVMMSISSRPANARGLVSFPCVNPLLNVYHLMRAGTSLLEEQDIWSTNPLFLTNREAALSETGIQQVQAACRILQDADISPSVIKYSLAASSVDSAMVIRDELKVGQNRLIPEFTFMDPRAIGKWDMRSIAETFPAVVAMDELEAGQDGKGARPPPNTDGTPQDTLADQAIRLRQLMSGRWKANLFLHSFIPFVCWLDWFGCWLFYCSLVTWLLGGLKYHGQYDSDIFLFFMYMHTQTLGRQCWKHSFRVIISFSSSPMVPVLRYSLP